MTTASGGRFGLDLHADVALAGGLCVLVGLWAVTHLTPAALANVRHGAVVVHGRHPVRAAENVTVAVRVHLNGCHAGGVAQSGVLRHGTHQLVVAAGETVNGVELTVVTLLLGVVGHTAVVAGRGRFAGGTTGTDPVRLLHKCILVIFSAVTAHRNGISAEAIAAEGQSRTLEVAGAASVVAFGSHTDTVLDDEVFSQRIANLVRKRHRSIATFNFVGRKISPNLRREAASLVFRASLNLSHTIAQALTRAKARRTGLEALGLAGLLRRVIGIDSTLEWFTVLLFGAGHIYKRISCVAGAVTSKEVLGDVVDITLLAETDVAEGEKRIVLTSGINHQGQRQKRHDRNSQSKKLDDELHCGFFFFFFFFDFLIFLLTRTRKQKKKNEDGRTNNPN
mmetsp:Transcript_1177/g.2819  ORF Transcript_1177/g.2819 Transcript_1177/m.2819 type:complete len:394 (+) Transcript_1177:434-1615(+)